MCALRHQLCDDSVIHQMRLSRAKQKYALVPGALSRETNNAAYASAAASGHYHVPSTALTSDDLDTQMAPVQILLFITALFIYCRTFYTCS